MDPRLDASGRYIRDPWGRDALAHLDPRRPALLIGTGLTMIDIALQLRAQPSCPPIIAVSRRGLLPQPHRQPGHLPEDLPGVRALLEDPPTARAYLRGLRRLTREAAAAGRDWRDVLAALRPLTPRLWQALPLPERARFLRHLKPFWEVHRHRVAPQLFDAFARLRDRGDVTIVAGRLLEVETGADGLRVRLASRGSLDTRDLDVGTIVNCSGPAADTRRLRDTLFERLHRDGLLQPDALGLGIETACDGTLIGRDGASSRVLYYVGPFLRARDWEATAVPELRRAVSLTVDHLLASLA
jgi:uncharacterized NAD(P)/FAD-binding protein YdhS